MCNTMRLLLIQVNVQHWTLLGLVYFQGPSPSARFTLMSLCLAEHLTHKSHLPPHSHAFMPEEKTCTTSTTTACLLLSGCKSFQHMENRRRKVTSRLGKPLGPMQFWCMVHLRPFPKMCLGCHSLALPGISRCNCFRAGLQIMFQHRLMVKACWQAHVVLPWPLLWALVCKTGKRNWKFAGSTVWGEGGFRRLPLFPLSYLRSKFFQIQKQNQFWTIVWEGFHGVFRALK